MGSSPPPTPPPPPHPPFLPTPLSRGGGSTAWLGGRELTLLCGFNQYTLLQNRDNSGLLGTPLYCSPKLGGAMPPPMLKLGGRPPPPCPPCGAPPAVYYSAGIPLWLTFQVPVYTEPYKLRSDHHETDKLISWDCRCYRG